MNRSYPDNIVFRILFPPISGMILYLAMLTIFDSLDQLTDSFFSQEAFFIVILTYLNHELVVYLIKRGLRNLILHFTILVMSAVLLNSLLIAGYFIYLLSYMHFRTELITINFLFIVFHVLINLYYLSIVNISRVRDISLQKEEDMARQLELELESFQNEMNPGLLMNCLETLINLIRIDIPESEKYIRTLSDHYRYLLDNRHKEITDLDREYDAAVDLVYLLGYHVEPGMVIRKNFKNGSANRIIPGSLLFIVNWTFNNMITSPLRPILIHVGVNKDQNIMINHPFQPRLLADPVEGIGEEKLNRSYKHYTGSGIERREGNEEIIWSIPRIPEVLDN